MQKSKLFLMISVTIFILGGIVAYKMLPGVLKDKDVMKESMSQNELGIPTEITSVQLNNLAKEINYVGTIESKNSVVLSPKIVSQVVQLDAQEGQYVRKGDVIASLDDSQLSAVFNSTITKIGTLKVNHSYLDKEVKNFSASNPVVKKLETLELNYSYLNEETEKYRTLYEKGAVPKDAYDKIKHEKDMAEMQLKELRATSEDAYSKLVHERDVSEMQLKELDAKLNELKISLEDTKIVAPISGKIRILYYKPGDLASVGKQFALIDDLENLVAKVNVTEQDLKKINVGTKTVLNITGVKDEIKTSISRIMPSINEKTRIGEVETDIPVVGRETNIATGASVEVKFITDEIKEGVVIPRAAVKRLQDKELVYVVENGLAREQVIKTGLSVGDKVQVTEGLNAGQKIAFKNLTKIYDGAKIHVVEGGKDK